MKVKNIKLSIKENKTVLNEFAKKLEKSRKGEKATPHEEVSFQNINVLRKVLTEKRIQLLHVVKQHTPDSIYELAKIADRDIKSINTDISILKELGLISLEKIHKERQKTKPRVEFDKLNVEIAI